MRRKVNNLEMQLNSYKEFNKNQILLHELNKALRQRDQYKAERDTLTNDLSWYKAKVSKLEHENEQLKQDLLRTEELQDEIIQLEKDFENKDNLLSEISQHIGNKPSSSTHKYFRGKLNALDFKEDE